MLPATAGTVGAYLLELRAKKLKASTIRRRAVAIGRVHDSQGHENPDVRVPPTPSKQVWATTDTYKNAMGRWRAGKSKPNFPVGTIPPGYTACVGGPPRPAPFVAVKWPA